jgi:hypothetical protein
VSHLAYALRSAPVVSLSLALVDAVVGQADTVTMWAAEQPGFVVDGPYFEGEYPKHNQIDSREEKKDAPARIVPRSTQNLSNGNQVDKNHEYEEPVKNT